ncbi:MAG: DNA-protecting protein DprA [Methanobrevibacter ruminantium]|uniref:DNA-processing protein DprA n=1 Tax=Methanobrevibacter ruminantium TaxID=83816 RepID=UPI002D810FAB|nr:DNA-processing protein DprA [Methanobrevibacter ruminantium]MCI5738126.1 DNA-protecting protein DprA [Methanobrevibacter ruminantium]
MNKFKELLFLSNIKRLGKTTINKKYLDYVEESEKYADFISSYIITSNFSKEKIVDACAKTEQIYAEVINDPEITAITVFDDSYPDKLKDMGDKKPIFLYVKGNAEALIKPNMAVIGTRKPSENSQKFEKELVKAVLENSDRVIVSGLALGCDKIAHETTVLENRVTVAVLPSGVNKITPASHKGLAEEIIENGGCLVSEYEPNAKAYRGMFVDRDQIVAALSDINFVIQCGEKSGTMHTVNATINYKNIDSVYHRDLYVYLPSELSYDNYITNNPIGDYSGNVKIIKEENGTRVCDIEEFCEELSILDSTKNTKTKKTSGQTTFDNFI